MWLPHRRPILHEVASPHPRRSARDVAVAALEPAFVTIAIVVGCAAAMTLLILLVTVAAPLGAVVFAWIAWRSDRELTGAAARLRARWGRSARVIRGGLGSVR